MLRVCLSNPSIIENMCIDRYASNKSTQPTYHIWTVAEYVHWQIFLKSSNVATHPKLDCPLSFSISSLRKSHSQAGLASQNIKLQP